VSASGQTANRATQAAAAAWAFASVFYFLQYILRSAPAVMVPDLTAALGVTAGGLSALLGLFYWGYAPFHLVAGLAMDQVGPRRVMPVAAVTAGVGCLLFATGVPVLCALGCFVQGSASAFALVGCAYIATTRFPPSRAASLIGATQMFGMAGALASSFLIAPAIAAGLGWRVVWLILGIATLPLAALLFVFIPPRGDVRGAPAARGAWTTALSAMSAVVSNPQSILCGLIAGLMFIPTTIFTLVWGVRFLQEGHDLPYMVAALRSASVAAGWIIGSPLLGVISDRIGRRKPVILGSAAVLLASLALILYAPAGAFPPFSLGLVAGMASGGAMILYTVAKEANRPEHSGTATGVTGFVNFSVSALLGPVFGMLLFNASEGAERELGHYQSAFQPLLYAVGLAILLAFLLRETGPAAGRARTVGAAAPETP
jgi:MFS family permease